MYSCTKVFNNSPNDIRNKPSLKYFKTSSQEIYFGQLLGRRGSGFIVECYRDFVKLEFLQYIKGYTRTFCALTLPYLACGLVPPHHHRRRYTYCIENGLLVVAMGTKLPDPFL